MRSGSGNMRGRRWIVRGLGMLLTMMREILNDS
jgi:hypothetical protein